MYKKFQNESDIKKFLDNIMLFNRYSFNNQILINIQKEDATYVSSFKNYTKLGYKINEDAKRIKVLIPNFVTMVKIKSNENIEEIKPYYLLSETEKEKYKDKQDDSVSLYKQKLTGFSLGNVFDIKDTNMPVDAIEHELNPVLDDAKASEIMDCFIKTIYNDNYKVRFEEMHDTKKGYCDYENQEIVIRKGMGSLVQMKVLIHEYAHALAHTHLKNNTRSINNTVASMKPRQSQSHMSFQNIWVCQRLIIRYHIYTVGVKKKTSKRLMIH